ncbi:MAG: dihydroxy-acid dehydratase [Flavobacteriales bacterium]
MSKLNTYSSKITQDDTLPAAQSMLHAVGLTEEDLKKPQVGIVSNWYEGNPCNMHLDDLGKKVKKSVQEKDLIGFQFTTIGVSDGMSMGTAGMRYSLPSREIIADSIEALTGAQHYDAVVAIPGCDKNMPGCLMALLRLNRPSLIIYGGTIQSGCYNDEKLNIVSSFEALGERNAGNISEEEFRGIVKNACPGPGACGGMYTANTMAVALEAMGMALPYSSSSPAISKEKIEECVKAADAVENLLQKNILPKDIVTKTSLTNAIKVAIVLGGSTNLVLHLLAVAQTGNIDLTIEDFQKINKQVPLLADLKPSGRFLMEDIFQIGGTPAVMKYLLNRGFLEGSCITVTGKTLAENLAEIPEINFEQEVVKPIDNPLKKDGHLRILFGNLAKDGAVAKITGKEGEQFKGKAKVYNSEEEANNAILSDKIQKGDVIVIRYVGPKGGPGMPEMLKPTSAIMGKGLGKEVALITDGRFSGGSHGFVVGHITPEAQNGGVISLLQDGDIITIDAINNTIDVDLSNEEIERRRKDWIEPQLKVQSGYLYKYAKTVASASEGCITDKF